MHITRSDRLPCGFSENALIAAALGEAPTHVNLQVRTHVAACQPCTLLLEQYRTLRERLASLAAHDDPAQGLREARQKLDQRLLGASRPRLNLTVWQSPVGTIRLGMTEKGVALVEFVRPATPQSFPQQLAHTFAVEESQQDPSALIPALEAYFSGQRNALGWVVDDSLMRSDFQREVLRATAAVPYGIVVTYQSIAETIGQPKAVRAVAQALRYNPIPIHIPCHRVIGSDGTLTGYAGNLVDIKQQILAIEGIPVVEVSKGLAIAKERMYVGWRRERSFCLPRCPSLKEQTAGNRAFIPSGTRAEEMGYTPCDICQPTMHSS
ncbi:MAG: methylated-DNA--[protein]-cysteine S-methyltransferase [Candidatus Binatia bacterium]